MEDAVKLAVEAEKIFNNSNLLLMTFVDDNISVDTLKSIHNSVKNVKSLQPGFAPQTRYIIEVTDIFDVPSVITALMKHNFEGRQVQVKLLEKYNDGYFGLDPCKLEVKNLPNNISNCDLKQLFPLSTDYKFLTPEINSDSKTVIVHFINVHDAISCFKTVNLVKYNDYILNIKFLRKIVNNHASSTIGAKKRFAEKDSLAFWDYSTDDEIVSDCVDNRRFKTERNEGVNCSAGRDIDHNALTSKQMTDTLIVHNLPSTVEENEILTLFPSLCQYTFLQKTSSKSCIIRFRTAAEAMTVYTTCDNIYMSRILQIDFYDKPLDESCYRSAKTARFSRDKCLNQQRKERIGVNSKNNFSFEQNVKNEQELHSENQEDSLTLRVKNLPNNTSKEDLRQLFPKHCKHKLKVEKPGDCASAVVYFLTSTAASNACNSMKNKSFRGRVLSIRFKSKSFKVNPFAVKTANNSVTRQSCTLPSGTAQSNTRSSIFISKDLNGDFITEDDVECKSEDNYSDDDDLEVDIGGYGSESDSGIFNSSHFGQSLKNNRLLPDKELLAGSNIKLPYYFVGDEVFPLRPDLMGPYSANSDVMDDYESEDEVPGKGLSESILAEDEDLF